MYQKIGPSVTTPGFTHLGGYGGVKDKSSWMRLEPSNKYFKWFQLSFNPVVTFLSLAIILAFSLWAMILPEVASTEFSYWKSWVELKFTWLYIGSQVWLALTLHYSLLPGRGRLLPYAPIKINYTCIKLLIFT